MLDSLTCFVTFELDGMHNWPDAPDRLAFLRDRHVHSFHFRVVFPQEASRNIEFIEFAADTHRFMQNRFPPNKLDISDFGPRSCEDLAELLANAILLVLPTMPWVEVTVSEDGRFGATVRRSKIATTA